MAAAKSYPPVVAGTHMWEIIPEKANLQREVVSILRKHGVDELDTARTYRTGDSETFIGNEGLSTQFKVTTKAPGGLKSSSKDSILEAASKSLNALKIDKVHIYLLHAPGRSTPISETMEAIQELYLKGAFSFFGVSNFTAKEVQELYDYCKAKNYVLPTVYQANYNLVARKNEKILFETLRKLGISIQVYSPVAGGFLTKTSEEIVNAKSGRWDPSQTSGKMYHYLYNKPSLLRYLDEFGEISKSSGISKLGLAYRWTRYNSFMDGAQGDTIIIGAADPKQVEEVLAELEKGPLPAKLVEKLEEMWKGIEADAPIDNLEYITATQA
ncbi:MAG: hypothetical protein Q9227_001057 [Pyrenula ochraceoflavens]